MLTKFRGAVFVAEEKEVEREKKRREDERRQEERREEKRKLKLNASDVYSSGSDSSDDDRDQTKRGSGSGSDSGRSRSRSKSASSSGSDSEEYVTVATMFTVTHVCIRHTPDRFTSVWCRRCKFVAIHFIVPHWN